jgi:hypothetical protein
MKDGRMKKQRFTEEQIIAVLKEQEVGAKDVHVLVQNDRIKYRAFINQRQRLLI